MTANMYTVQDLIYIASQVSLGRLAAIAAIMVVRIDGIHP